MANPSKADHSNLSAATLSATPHLYRIQGKFLVIRRNAVLPPFCVMTNLPVTPQEMVVCHLSYVDSDSGLLLILSPVLGSLPFLFKDRSSEDTCMVTYGVSTSYKRSQSKRALLWLAVLSVSVVAVAFAIFFKSVTAIAVSMAFLWPSLVILVMTFDSIGVTKKTPGEFWISGCHKSFLSRIDKPLQFDFPGRL
jgi:hypothetical protein